MMFARIVRGAFVAFVLAIPLTASMLATDRATTEDLPGTPVSAHGGSIDPGFVVIAEDKSNDDAFVVIAEDESNDVGFIVSGVDRFENSGPPVPSDEIEPPTPTPATPVIRNYW